MMYKNIYLHWSAKMYGSLISLGGFLKSLLLLYMRLTWGHQFFLSGLHMFSHTEETLQTFTSLGIWAPSFHVYLVAFLETVGGFCLFIGFASRLAAIPLSILMLVALSLAHSPEISEFRFLLEPLLLVREPTYPYLITSMMVLVFGPGRVSIDALVKRWVQKQPSY